MKRQHRVVIIGGGFGGLYAAQSLKRTPVQMTLLDRRNFHLLQLLLYQVATGWLSAANIAVPLRAVLKHQNNAQVLLGDVVDIDVSRRQGRCATAPTCSTIPSSSPQGRALTTSVTTTGKRMHQA